MKSSDDFFLEMNGLHLTAAASPAFLRFHFGSSGQMRYWCMLMNCPNLSDELSKKIALAPYGWRGELMHCFCPCRLSSCSKASEVKTSLSHAERLKQVRKNCVMNDVLFFFV